MEVKITEYNIRNGSVRWQISNSIKVILEQFLLVINVSEYALSKFVTLKMYIKDIIYNIRSGGIRW